VSPESALNSMSARLGATHSTQQVETVRKGMKRSFIAVIALLCMTACAVGAASVPSVSSQSVELSPSVQLVGKYDWELIKTEKGETWSRCLDMVW
jgi:hypothetical protein